MGKKLSATPRGRMSISEALKSLRDVLLIAIAGAIPAILETLNAVHFGEHQAYWSIGLMILTPFLNRFANIWRVK